MAVNKTLQQRLGFQDPELTSPSHDALVLWIGENALSYMAPYAPDPLRKLSKYKGLKDEACIKELEHHSGLIDTYQKTVEDYGPSEIGTYPEGKYLPADIVWTKGQPKYPEAYKTYCERLAETTERYQQIRQIHSTDMPVPEIPSSHIDGMKYEFPVSTGHSNFIVGFLDVVATLRYPDLALEGIQLDRYTKNKVLGLEKDKAPKLVIEWDEAHFAFEAKTSIKSLGELLRQLNTYKEYFTSWWKPQLVVVSSDTRYRDVIISQGFQFWESPSL